jgi:hypothetical protein
MYICTRYACHAPRDWISQTLEVCGIWTRANYTAQTRLTVSEPSTPQLVGRSTLPEKSPLTREDRGVSIPSVPRISLSLVPHSAPSTQPSLAAAAPCRSPPEIQPRRSPAPHPLDVVHQSPPPPYLAPPPSPRGRRLGQPAGAVALAVRSKEQLQLGTPMPPQINPKPPDRVDLGSRCPSLPRCTSHGRRPKLLQLPAMEGLLHGALYVDLSLAL